VSDRQQPTGSDSELASALASPESTDESGAEGWRSRLYAQALHVPLQTPRVLFPPPPHGRPPSPHYHGGDTAASKPHRMTRPDPVTAGADAKRTAMLLRDARAVLRRLDILASVAIAADDPAVLLIADARETVERLVIQLGRRGQLQQRRAREAVRRIR
jgi:hypothetical protein